MSQLTEHMCTYFLMHGETKKGLESRDITELLQILAGTV